MKKRIALLFGDTGGGHRSAAQAIAQGLRIVHGDEFDVELVNGLENLPPIVSAFTETYPLWVNHARVLYAIGFHASNDRKLVNALRSVFEPLSDPAADALVQDHPADLYISCHPLFNDAIPPALRRIHRRARYIHVVTDLVSGHVAHYSTNLDHLIVPTDKSRREAIKNGVPSGKITMTGQPVSPDFCHRLGQREKMRGELGLDDRLTVLLMGGGDGMGRLEATARQIALTDMPVQLLVVCGRNTTVKENLESLNPRIPMKVFGFVNNVPELMGAADVLVTKAGPGTICEAFIAGLPIVLYDAVPGQEEGNVDYVVETGAGAWCPTPRLVVNQLKEWIMRPPALEWARRASISLARPNSAIDIAKAVARFAPP